MASSALYTVNTNVSANANGMIPLGTVSRRFGCCLAMEGDSIVCKGRGYYDFSASVTLIPSAAGIIGIQLVRDGVPVPGANAYGSGTADAPLNLSICALTREMQQCSSSTLGLMLESATADATIQNVATVTRKA